MERTEDIHKDPLDLGRISFLALIVGAAALALAIVVALIGGGAGFYRAWLSSFLWWGSLTLGCVGVGLLYHLVGGRWGELIRPLFETGARSILMMVVLFIPIALGIKYIYPWADEQMVAASHVLHNQHKWVNTPYFLIRAAIYFVVWGGMALLLNGWAKKHGDELLKGGHPRRIGGFAGFLIVIFVVTVTLAAVDWAMSVQPGWFSTVYALSFVAAQGLSCISFATLVLVLVITRGVKGQPAAVSGEPDRHHHHGPAGSGNDDPEGEGDVTTPTKTKEAEAEEQDAHVPAGPVSPTDWGDLGNMMLMFTMLWAYLQLSQFLIIWSGNLPHETVFYEPRMNRGWQWAGLGVVIFNFAIPFFLLLMRDVKRNARRIGMLAAFILLVRYLDWYWQIQPSFSQVKGFFLRVESLQHLLTPIAVGGLWVAFFAWQLRGRRLTPAPKAHGGHHG